MKRFLLFFILAFSITSLGWGQTFYDGFPGTGNIGGTGDLTSNNGWTTHNPLTGGGTIPITTGSLSLTGFQASAGNKVSLPGNNTATARDVNAALSLGTGITVAYFSALINVIDNTQLATAFADASYFMHFGKDAGTTNTTLFARLHIKKTASGLNYRLGIQNVSGTGASQTEATTDMDFGTTYLIVVKYDFNGASNDIATLWVAPTSLGGAEPAGGFTNNGSSSTSPTAFGSVCIRNSSATPKADIDEVRSGLTWADVTPTGTISAPSVQTSDFTFSTILQTQMNVSWTNGNGGKRVVKINTSNSFTPPANTTDPSANSIYIGSGEQVIYNGAGNTVPTVTGLSANTTYWFQAWEYNGTGSNTIYCTGTGLNNPKSQTTLDVATAPVLGAPTATSIKANSAILGGNILADGGSAIIERGTVWSVNTPVTLADFKLAEGGTATGVFMHLRAGLPVDSLIHFAAYAINATGTTLSAESSFTTLLGEPSNHATSFLSVSPTYSTIVNTWLDNDGDTPADGFLILANTSGVFPLPIDTVPPTTDVSLADGSGAQTVIHGLQTCTWNNLVGSTTYYFAIYPYTNSGNNIDYKTSPVAPTSDTTTLSFNNPVAAWTFDATAASPNTPTSVAANFGYQTGTAMLYADGTNGSSPWLQASELNAFAGTTTNDPREGGAISSGMSYCPIGGTLNSANGKSMILKFSMSALQDPILTYATRYSSATGFNSHQWAWSTNETNFTDFGTNTAPTSTTFVTKTLDLSAINAVDGAPTVYLRVTFDGVNGTTSNNRLDNIVIRASAASTIAPTVATNAATAVEATTATLNGTVNANNQNTAVSFEYGTQPSTYGTPVPGVPATATGNTTTAITASLTGLSFNTTYYYRITGTNGSGTSNGTELTFLTTCPIPDDAGQITGPTVVCANGTNGYQYSVPAIPNATSYVWSFPAGTELIGSGSNTVTAFFTPGVTTFDVSVFGTNDCGDGNASNPYTISLTQPVVVDVTIVASANPVTAGTSVTFTATPVNGGAIPSYQWKVDGIAEGTNSNTFAYIPSDNDMVTCELTSNENCPTNNPATSNIITMVVTSGVPVTLNVQNITLTTGMSECYDATQTIWVAGGLTFFALQSGALATFIAGQNIFFLPGTTVLSGGHMYGSIDPDGPYCPQAKTPAQVAGQGEDGFSMMDNTFKIYPNPTSGTFTIEQLGDAAIGQVNIEVLGTLGEKILTADWQGVRKQEVSIKGNPPGIYFVKLMAGAKVQIVKIILTN